MSYEKGELVVLPASALAELRALVEAKDFGDRYDELTDAYGCRAQFMTEPQAFLTHSCDEWEIGGPEQIRAMIADLQAALALLEEQ